MNLNVSNVNFGRWKSSVYYDVLGEIQAGAKKHGVDYKDTQVYEAFENLHNNTYQASLIFDKYGRVKDENKVFSYFPKDENNPKSMFCNIMAASRYLNENGKKNEAVVNGFVSKGGYSGSRSYYA